MICWICWFELQSVPGLSGIQVADCKWNQVCMSGWTWSQVREFWYSYRERIFPDLYDDYLDPHQLYSQIVEMYTSVVQSFHLFILSSLSSKFLAHHNHRIGFTYNWAYEPFWVCLSSTEAPKECLFHPWFQHMIVS